MSPIRALLVEDDLADAVSIKQRLSNGHAGDFEIEHVPTLDSALTRLRAGKLDIVLLDLNLPDSRGIDTVVKVRAAAPDVPIVVVTNVDDETMALRAVQERASDYLIKKRADEVALELAVRLSLERHRIQSALESKLQTLTKQEARLRQVLASSPDGVVILARNGSVLFSNTTAATLLDCPPEKLHGRIFGDSFGPQSRVELKIGAERVVEAHGVDIRWDDQPACLASVFDITEHKRAEADLQDVTARMRELNARLERLASIDPLTEVPNRRGLEAELAIEVKRKRRTGAPLAAVLLDCDDFKRINETQGHGVGDVVLKELANRIKDSLRPSDHIGRIGGDEFLMLLPDTRFTEAVQVAERLRLSVSDRPLRLSSGAVSVTASLGIEMVSDEILSIDDVLAHTQLALQHSKRGGKNRVSTQDGGAGVSEFDALVTALQTGSSFRVVRQPILRLIDESIVGWEMLSRGPQGIFEMPRDFFRVALEHNILSRVDLQCLAACLRAAPELPALSCCHINLFPSTLLEVPSERLLELFPRRPAGLRLCIEISEQQLIGEPSVLRGQVRALKAAGILVAIDDVGFGRSSLETLILLEPDLVKIDPKFTQGVARNSGRERSLRRLVAVVGAMGSELVAEGIESRDDLEILLEVGVPFGQGFLWGRPA